MYSAIEFAKKLCEENKGKVLLGKKVDPANVTIYCNRPDQIKIPKETGWYFSKGTFKNKHNTETGVTDTIEVLPKFYLE